MPLDALAPDQRAVVQLVLQRGRSYAQIAELLKISEDAVRARAHAGLAALAPGVELPADKLAPIADFLLGQQNGKPRQATRRLLRGDEGARAWAEAVRAELENLGGPLPDLPAPAKARGAAAKPAPAKTPPEGAPPAAAKVPAKASPEGAPPAAAKAPTKASPEEAPPEGAKPARAKASPEGSPPAAAEEEPAEGGEGQPAEAEPVQATPAEAALAAEEGPPKPAPRPRPLRDQAPRPRARPVAATEGAPGAVAAASSRLGGAVLIGLGVVAVVVLILVLFVWGGDDKADTASSKSATPTPTPTATPQAVGEIRLKGVNGSRGQGVMRLYASQGQLAFTLEGTNVPQNRRNEAYAVWFTTPGDGSQRLGFAQPVGQNGQLGTTGPRTEDLAKFPRWLARYKQVVVTRERSGNAKKPGPIVLRGALPSA
jgi:hypothetical protein